MKRFFLTWLTIVTLTFPSIGFAALPPTRSSGQSDALSTTFDFKAPYSQVTKYSGTGGLIETGSYQLLKNPSFEATTYSANWTASGGTLAAATSTNIFFGKSATWDASSASQTLTTDAVTVPEGFKGNNCEAAVYVKVPSGTAIHKVQAWDGTNVLAEADLINSVYFTKNTVPFPCPTSGTIALRLVSVASDEPLIALDEGYLGLARNVGVADLTTEWEAWTPSSSWTGTITYTGFKRRVGTNQEIKFRIATGGAPTGSALTLNIPSECVIDTAKVTGNNARNPLGNLLIFDSDTGANIYGTVQANNTTSVALNVILTGNASTSPIGQIGATTPITFASGDTIDGYFSVPCVGWSASQVVMPDAQGWFAAGEITGANPTLGTTAQSSYVEITNGSLTLTPQTNSAAVGIACASGTTSVVGTYTCSSNESFGFITNVPRSGVYEVCFSYTISGATGNTVTLQSSLTSASSSTIVTNGLQRTSFYNSSTTVAIGSTHRNCSTYSLSAGSNTFRLMYEQDAATNAPAIIADGNTSLGQRNFAFDIRPVNSQQQAILANSVISNVANGVRVESASIDNTGSATIVRQTGSWISSVSRTGTGVVEVNYSASLWSAPPSCTVSINAATLIARVESVTTTRLTTRMITSAGTSTDNPFYVTCIGPR